MFRFYQVTQTISPLRINAILLLMAFYLSQVLSQYYREWSVSDKISVSVLLALKLKWYFFKIIFRMGSIKELSLKVFGSPLVTGTVHSREEYGKGA